MRLGLHRERIDRAGDLSDDGACGRAAVQPQVERHLVVARASRVQRGTGAGYLGQAALDRSMDVFVGVDEHELVLIELAFDTPEPSLDRAQLRRGEQLGGGEAARVSDAAGDIKGVELEIRV